MQLTHQGKNIRQALIAASSAVLAAVSVLPADAAEAEKTDDGHWKVDSALLLYKENGGRVSAAEPVVSLRQDFDEDRSLSVKIVADSLTGASPNGAARAGKVQIFTGPSGIAPKIGGGGGQGDDDEGGSPSVANPGELPVDKSFKDTRAALSVNYLRPAGANMKLNVGGNFSNETDFQSVGINGALSRDFNAKNTTVSAGLNLEFDNIKPVGGAPLPLSATSLLKKDGSHTRTLTEALLGVTQVVNRHLLFQLNYSLSSGSGYQSDPYKMLTLLDSSNKLISDPAGTPDTYLYLFEHRPDARTRHGVFAGMKYHVGHGQVLDSSVRVTADTWGIHSQTLDARYYLPIGSDGYYLEPHLRLFSQTAADFYKPWLKQDTDFSMAGGVVTALLRDASADPRLGAFAATTIGLKVGKRLGPDSELSLRIEQYAQQGKTIHAPSTGDLAGQEQTPSLKAAIVQVGYSYVW